MKKLINLAPILILALTTLSSFNENPKAKATANIEVKVKQTKILPGNIKVALCNSSENFMDKLFLEGIIKSTSSGTISYTFKNVPKGTYAIRVFQDVDGDGQLSSNFFGIPNEPFGFSLNPKIKYGPPSFKQASFELKTDISLSINLSKFEL
jgi:uncharacterized protein (DUF2141 family)